MALSDLFKNIAMLEGIRQNQERINLERQQFKQQQQVQQSQLTQGLVSAFQNTNREGRQALVEGLAQTGLYDRAVLEQMAGNLNQSLDITRGQKAEAGADAVPDAEVAATAFTNQNMGGIATSQATAGLRPEQLTQGAEIGLGLRLSAPQILQGDLTREGHGVTRRGQDLNFNLGQQQIDQGWVQGSVNDALAVRGLDLQEAELGLRRDAMQMQGQGGEGLSPGDAAKLRKELLEGIRAQRQLLSTEPLSKVDQEHIVVDLRRNLYEYYRAFGLSPEEATQRADLESGIDHLRRGGNFDNKFWEKLFTGKQGL